MVTVRKQLARVCTWHKTKAVWFWHFVGKRCATSSFLLIMLCLPVGVFLPMTNVNIWYLAPAKLNQLIFYIFKLSWYTLFYFLPKSKRRELFGFFCCSPAQNNKNCLQASHYKKKNAHAIFGQMCTYLSSAKLSHWLVFFFVIILKSTKQLLCSRMLDKMTNVLTRICFMSVLIKGTISHQSFHRLMDLRVIYQH